MKLLTIHKAARFLNVSANTLRRWEEMGKLLPQRSISSYRLYDLETLKKFKTNLEKTRLSSEVKKAIKENSETEDIPLMSVPNLTVTTMPLPSYNTITVETPSQLIQRNAATLNIQNPRPSPNAPKTYNTTLPKPLANNFFLSAFLTSLLIFTLGSSVLLLKGINSDQNITGSSNAILEELGKFELPTGTVLAATAKKEILFINTDTNIQGQLSVNSFQASESATIGGNLLLGPNVTVSASEPTQPFTANFPAISGSDDFLFAAAAQTLTNKTISATSNTLTNIPNSALTNSSITISAGTAMSGGGSVALGGSVTLNNAGVTSLKGGTDISVSASTGSVTVNDDSTLSTVTGRGATTSTALTLNGAITIGSTLSVTSTSVLTGNVGIGTATVTNEALQIQGRALLAQVSAPSTTTNRLYNVSGNLFFNGVNLTAGGALPAGTTNQTLYHNGTVWTATSNLGNDGTNVGIGTTSPSAVFDIVKSADGDFTVDLFNSLAASSGSTNESISFRGTFASTSGGKQVGGQIRFGKEGDYTAGTANDSYMAFYTALDNTDTEYLRILSSGNIGIGTSTPAYRLTVAGAAGITGNTTVTANIGIGTTSFTNKLEVNGATAIGSYVGTAAPANGLIISGNVGIGTTGPGGILDIYATGSPDFVRVNMAGAAKGLVIERANDQPGIQAYLTSDWSTTTDLVLQGSGSNVGIGTTAPTYLLDVRTSAVGTAALQIDTNQDATVKRTGLRFATQTDYFSISTNGTASSKGDLVFSPAGNVGIGTTVPSAFFDVKVASSGTALAWFRSGSAINTALQITDQGHYTTLNASGTGGARADLALTADGNVGIETSAPSQTLHVSGTARITSSVAVTDDRTLCTIAASGEIEFKDGACGTSSRRYKENIQDLGYGLSEILQLKPVYFNYTKDSGMASDLDLVGDRTKRKLGFIAEDMQEVIPEVVIWQNGQIDGVDYAYLTALLTKGVQQLATQTAAKYKLNSSGELEVPALKVGKLILDANLDTSGTANDNGTLSYKLTELETKINTLDTQSNQQLAQTTSKLSTLETQVAGIATSSSQLAGQLQATSSNIATTSAQLLSAKFDISSLKQDIENLKLTPPDVLSATSSAQFAKIDVKEKVSTLDLSSTGIATFSGTLKALADSFLGQTTIAGDLSQDGTLSITLGKNINALPILYLQNSPLAEKLDIFEGRVVVDKTGLLSAVVVAANEYRVIGGKTSGSATLEGGESSVEIPNTYISNSSRILITPTKQTPSVLAVTSKTPGQKFAVSASLPPVEDISFDYWIINEVTKQ